jgi:hypothetical protein
MTLQQLIHLFRVEAFDNSQPPLFTDDEIIIWLNEAQVEASMRANLLRENSNVLMTQIDVQQRVMDYPTDPRMIQIEYASLIYKNADGMLPYVLAITSAEVLDSVRPFWRTLPFRPTGIIHYDGLVRTDCLPDTAYTLHVEGYRLPLWQMDQVAVSETLATGTITLTAGSSGQVNSITVNGIEVLGSVVAFVTDLPTTAAAIATQINANQRKFVASSLGAVITLTDLPTSGSMHNGYAVAFSATGITATTTALAGGIDAVVTSPEITGIHHRHLVKWALHRGYQKPDSEIYDPEKSDKSLKEFVDMFGERPDASYRKRANSNRPHRNTAYG